MTIAGHGDREVSLRQDRASSWPERPNVVRRAPFVQDVDRRDDDDGETTTAGSTDQNIRRSMLDLPHSPRPVRDPLAAAPDEALQPHAPRPARLAELAQEALAQTSAAPQAHREADVASPLVVQPQGAEAVADGGHEQGHGRRRRRPTIALSEKGNIQRMPPPTRIQVIHRAPSVPTSPRPAIAPSVGPAPPGLGDDNAVRQRSADGVRCFGHRQQVKALGIVLGLPKLDEPLFRLV